jgi:hypothetical protein
MNRRLTIRCGGRPGGPALAGLDRVSCRRSLASTGRSVGRPTGGDIAGKNCFSAEVERAEFFLSERQIVQFFLLFVRRRHGKLSGLIRFNLACALGRSFVVLLHCMCVSKRSH